MIQWLPSDEWARRYPEIRGLECLTIGAVASLSNPRSNSLIFASTVSTATVALLKQHQDCLLIFPEDCRDQSYELESKHGIIYTSDPRYLYAEILGSLCTPASLRGVLTWDQGRGIILGERVEIHPKATVEPGATVASDCTIEEGAYVMTGARIGPKVQIGERSVIKENCVVGGWGFGYAISKGKPPLRIPHLGGVKIGREVEVGSFTTVCSGTIDPTILEDYAKVDDHVHIAHNCHLEQGAMVIACAEVSGSVRVGARSWLGPNCSVIDRISIGADCTVGLGAVVRKSLPAGSIVAGNPARTLTDIKLEKEKMQKIDALLANDAILP